VLARETEMRQAFPSTLAARPGRLAHGFVAGFLATLVFHQTGIALLHLAGVFDGTAFDMRPVPPFGVPSVLSLAFWGGAWGIVFALAEPTIARCPGGYWLGAVLFGAVVPTVVFWFVVLPLKGLLVGLGFQLRVVAIALVVDALWGLGTALFLHLRPRT
jgi:hypothetical protein